MSYLLHLLIYFSIYVIVALSLNLVVGYCGLLTLAHAAYFATGGYIYALLTLQLGWGFLPAAAATAVVCGALSLLVAVPAWRFRGDSFVLVTLAVQALIVGALHNWVAAGSPPGTWSNLTNGPFGLAGISRPAIFGIHLDTQGSFFALSTVLTLAACVICRALYRSPWGRLLRAIRDDELAARGLGKNVRLAKLQALAVSGALVGLAGALYAAYTSYLHPSVGSLEQSILMLCMVIVGGAGNFRGPILGAAVLLLIPELLRLIQVPDAAAGHFQLLAYGLLLIFVVLIRPQGLAGNYRLE